jgi:RNA polymerase primary sigma factor
MSSRTASTPTETPAPAGLAAAYSNTADAEINAYVARATARNLADLSSLSAFQRQMDRYPQLSPSAQLELVERVRTGQAARERLSSSHRKTEEPKLVRAVRDGERAAEYLVGSNFRLVLLICSEKARERLGMERAGDMMPDLVGEANVALAEAIAYYDPARCPVFATYVGRVVRDRVQYVLSRDSSIRLAPSWHRLKRIAAVRTPILAAELGRRPTEDELRDDLFAQCRIWAYNRLTPEQKVLPEPQRESLMMAKLRKQGMLGALASLSDVLVAAQSVTSLDTPLGDDTNGATRGDLVAAESSDELFDELELGELGASLEGVLSEFTEREQQIIRLRYGFDPSTQGELPTYGQIGERFGVTAERIRQIERSVLDRLRSSENARDRLAAFLPGLEGVDLGTRFE